MVLRYINRDILHTLNKHESGQGSSVSIATELDGPGSNPCGDEFFACSDRPWGTHCFLHNGYRLFHRGRGSRGVGLTLPPPSSAEGPRKSKAIPLRTLRVAYKRGEILPKYVRRATSRVFWYLYSLVVCYVAR